MKILLFIVLPLVTSFRHSIYRIKKPLMRMSDDIVELSDYDLYSLKLQEPYFNKRISHDEKTYKVIEKPIIQPSYGLTNYMQNYGFIFNLVVISILIVNFIRNQFATPFVNTNSLMVLSPNVTKDMWAGSPEIFEECTDIISFFNDKEKYADMNIDIPRGFLLEGPPGCGKTQLAKIIATECDVNFISVSGSDFVELFVGNGALKVRNLFKLARKNRPCIIFIDEIDAVGKKRSTKLNNNDEQEQTLNQLLFEMDGFNDNDDILILAATNRKDVLDDALLRPGRFDRIIYVPTPDYSSREKILNLYLQNKPHERNISFEKILDLTDGMSGAQLKNIINEAAINTIKRNATLISNMDIEKSVDKSILGIVKKTDDRLDDTRRRVAIHEIGHAILVNHFSNYFVFHKVSIQNSYSGFEGYTMYNDVEKDLYTKNLLKKKIMVLFGGFIAEKLFYGNENVSAGSSHDIMEANKIAHSMIKKLGFGKQLIDEGESSEYNKMKSDIEIHNLLKMCYYNAKKILESKKEYFDRILPVLLDKQSISGDYFNEIIDV